ncbi:MAG TPA: hypothetical protein VNT77_02305 [Allosphingosinicella sp.]|nr:hypothetical protein [Allosphingosinicella sp.]
MADKRKKGGSAGPEGTMLRSSGKDGPQLVKSKGRRWTDEAEAIFLDTLAASCNVKMAAAASGFSTEAIYRRRRFHPDFAERWQSALEQGYVRIEMALVKAAEDALAGFAPDPDSPLPAMTIADAINILQLHRASVKGDGAARPGWPACPRSLDEVRGSIIGKLEALDAAEAGEDPLGEP